MAWKRGNQSVEIEMSRVQTKIEDWSVIFDGEDGLKGMIRLIQEDFAIRDERDKAHAASTNRKMLFCAVAATIPVLVLLGQLFHVVPVPH